MHTGRSGLAVHANRKRGSRSVAFAGKTLLAVALAAMGVFCGARESFSAYTADVVSGQSVSNETISDWRIQTVEHGGTTTNVSIAKGAQYVSGIANSSTVYQVQRVYSGGVANASIIAGGTQIVEDGGVAYGTAFAAGVGGSVQQIMTGGKTYNTVIPYYNLAYTPPYQSIEIGGEAIGTIVNGVQKVSGTATDTTVNATGVQILYSGATLSGTTTINGGTMHVAGDDSTSGAIALGTGGATINTQTYTLTLSGDVSGTSSLTKIGTGTLSLSGDTSYTGATTVSAGTLSLGGANSSSSIDIASGATLNFNNASAVTYSGTLTGDGALTKTGAGTLSLAVDNAYTGGTTVSAGTLAIASAGRLGTGGLTLAGGTLQTTADLSLTSTVTLGAGGGTFATNTGTSLTLNTVTGSGALTKSGSGALALSGTNDYTGGTTLAGGTLAASSWAAVGESDYGTSGLQHALTFSGGTLTVGGSNVLAAGQTLNLGSQAVVFDTTSGDQTVAAGLTGTGTVTKSGTGTLTLTSDTSYSGATTITAGTLSLAGATSSSSMDVASGATLNFNNAGAVTYANAITGAGAVTKTGTGTLTLFGANDYSGGTKINAGTLNISSDTNLGTTNTTTPGTLTLNGGTLQITSGVTLASTRNILLGTGGGSFDTNGSTLEIDGAITDAESGTPGSLTKTGAGTLILSSTGNTYTGTTFVNRGTLQAGANGAFSPSSAVTVDAGATLDVNSKTVTIAGLSGSGTVSLGTDPNSNGSLTVNTVANTSYQFDGQITGYGSLTKAGSGTLTLTGTNTYTGATKITGGTLSISSAANLQGTSGIMLDGGTLQATSSLILDKSIALGSGGGTFDVTNSGDTLTLSGAITDAVSGTAGSLTKTGAGTLKLTNTGNTYSGPTYINQGTLQAGGANVFSANSVVVLANTAGATLDLNNYDQTIAGLSGGGSTGGNVTLGSATLTVNQSTDTTYAGIISGSGKLKKSGSGTLTLTGTNAYSGGTIFAGGTIAVASDANLGDTAGSLTFDGGTLKTTADFETSRDIIASSSGTLDNGGNSVSLKSSLTGSGTLTLAGSGTVTLNSGFDASTSTGTIVVGSGTTLAGVGTVHNLVVNGTISPGYSPGTITVNGDFTLGATGTYYCQVSASGASDLIKVSGTATLSGTLTIVAVDSTYTSGTSWNILQASSVSGSYSGVTYAGTPQNWAFVPSVSGTGATLTLTRDSYASSSTSAQSASTGTALDAAAYTATGEMASLITVLDNSYGRNDASLSSAQTLANTIRSTTTNALTDYSLNVLSAEVYDAFSQNVFAAGRLLTSAQHAGLHEGEDGVGQGFASPLEIGPTSLASQNNQYGLTLGLDTTGGGASSLSFGRLGVFIKPIGMRAFQQGSSSQTGYATISGGITGGVFYRPSSELTLALAPGFVTQSISLHSEGGGQGTVNDWSLGFLAAYRNGPWHADAGVRGAYNTFQSSRSLPLPNGTYTAKGNWDGWNVNVSTGGGYDFTAGDYTFGPLAAVSWQRLHENAFKESGAGTLGQSIRARNTEALNTVLGARVARTFETPAGDVTPEVRVGWSAQWLGESQNIVASFIGSLGSAYQVKSTNHAYNSALVDVGVSMRVSSKLTATARAGVELLRPGYESQAASLGLKYTF